MKRLILTAVLVVTALSAAPVAATAAANPSTNNKLQCFAENGATCTLSSDGTATLSVTAGQDAGVFVTPGFAKPIGNVTKLSFSYLCSDTTTTTCVIGGSPRFSIPIDTNGDSKFDAYAFIDANNCRSTGTVDLSCPAFFAPTLYTNWAAFAAVNPTYHIAENAVTFVIADQPYSGTIFNVQLGKK
jgi:hypothetical protein